MAKLLVIFNRVDQLKQLPREGGILQQPEKLMACMDIIRRTHDKYKIEQMEREKRVTELKSKLKGR